MPRTAEHGPRPAPEIKLLDSMMEKTVRIGELLESGSASRSTLMFVAQRLQAIDDGLDKMIQSATEGAVIFEDPKRPKRIPAPPDIFGNIPKSPSKEARRVQRALDRELKRRTPGEILAGVSRKKEKPKKRPVLFEDSTGTYRGKVGFAARALYRDKTVSASRIETSIGTDVSGKISELRRRGWKIDTKVDRERNETFYTRKSSPPKKK